MEIHRGERELHGEKLSDKKILKVSPLIRVTFSLDRKCNRKGQEVYKGLN